MTLPVERSGVDSAKSYGFVIDNRKCIGCHACSIACKSENEVPLGVNRTWVKYVETGVFPNTRRHFQVTRCNHCANPPCVRICPTSAMYQRADGIVEFDASACIGCKACMQACPYDAIYIDPETGTAAKCHYCAHRTDIGLEPACVVVCPEQAIIAGDMNDPTAEISQLLARHEVTVRKPEQGTAPKLFYINGNDAALHPTAVERTPQTFMWADVLPLHAGEQWSGGAEERGSGGAEETRRLADSQTYPIHFGGRVAEQMVQVAYNAQHKMPWHWPVPAYLVTKGIGAGIFMIFGLGVGLNWFPFDGLAAVVAGILTVLLIGLTTALLVFDLDRPGRFLYILLRPQWRSWLARGAVILIGFSLLVGIWWLLETAAYSGWLPPGAVATVRPLFLWLGLPLAAGVAIYTAFLFAQAEGRDLWQSPLLPAHLLIQSFMAGGAAFLIMDLFMALPRHLSLTAATIFAVALIADLFVTLVGEFGIPHASEVAARAAHEIRSGRYRNYFWWGSIVLGHVAPLGLLVVGWVVGWLVGWLAAVAAVCAIVGLYLYEYAFVMAPQEVPNS
jgi:Fe-S-cluster-containing dehydrogenase component/formate-dependent nitrite reductase membrane component NrfD